ncbi:MAG TPA: tripartite tricarboxylate transporter permease [Clostridia bacterium]|nr:tripartite tricarboxylate transporter permease [Clostridia bacterium]
MENVVTALVNIFSAANFMYLIAGSVIGLIIGVLPGLGPTFGTALVLPFTFGMSPDSALILLSAVYSCTAYGDGITSILLNVPGGPGGVALTFDGYTLTRKGKAAEALGALVGSSFVGGIVGVLALMFIAPPMAEFSLKIGPAEYFMLAMFGLSMVAVAGKGDTAKGLILGCLGLLFSFVGIDVITGAERFTFGSTFLEDGLSTVSATIGLFALSQVFILAEEGGSIAGEFTLVTKPWSGIRATIKYWYVTLRSSILGVSIGMIPGIGISTASILSYIAEKRISKNPESYGEGNIRGVIAPQASSNACVSGELIPAFALGIPGGATAAIFLAAMTLHGLRPGLSFFSTGGALVDTIFMGMIMAQFVILFFGLTSTPLLAKITKVPNAILVPVIMALCFVGAFAVNNYIEDVIVAIVFGVIGYVMFKNKWPMQCLVLGLVLGEIAESNFHRAMQISGGSYGIFVQKPISLVLLISIVAILFWTYFGDVIKAKLKNA